MKKIYFILCLAISVFANAQVINFPDANFKAKLLQANSTNMIALDAIESPITIDTNGNGEIEVAETLNVKVLIIDNSGIADLTGISGFPNLKWLRCSHNLLTNITIDSAITIEQLFASHNAISSVSVNFGDNIEGLDLSYNNLTSFSVEDAIFWETFNLSENDISSLSLTNVSLDHFNIAGNNLSQIQFTGNVWFFGPAIFSYNQFTLLDLSDALFDYDNSTIILGYNNEDRVLFSETSQPGNLIYRSDNAVFDMGNFHGTTSCDPEYTGNVSIQSSPNLQSLIFKNGFNHNYITCDEGGTIFQNPAMNLQITNCPNLNHLCVDNGEFPAIQARINQLGLQGQILVDSNCTSSVLGTETFTTAEPFVLSPVPASNVLQIHSSNNLEIRNIEIYNNLGQIIQKEIGNQQSIDVSKLAKGSYYMKIYTADLTSVKQFLKE